MAGRRTLNAQEAKDVTWKMSHSHFCLQVILSYECNHKETAPFWNYLFQNRQVLRSHPINMVYVGVEAGTRRRDCAATSPTRELSVFSNRTIAGGLITGRACD